MKPTAFQVHKSWFIPATLVLCITCALDAIVAWLVPKPFPWLGLISGSLPLTMFIFVGWPLIRRHRTLNLAQRERSCNATTFARICSAAPRAGGAQARAMRRAAQPIPRLRGMHPEQRGRASRLALQFQDASRPHPRRNVSFFGSDGVRVDRGGGELRMPEPSLQ